MKLSKIKLRSLSSTEVPPISPNKENVTPSSALADGVTEEKEGLETATPLSLTEIPDTTSKVSENAEQIDTDKLNDCLHLFNLEYENEPALQTVDVNKRGPLTPSFNVGSVTVKAEELGLVLVVLLLWAGAISLFINRWGKLRMLEPYQPAYTAPVASPPPRGPANQPPFININIQSTSSLSLEPMTHKSLSPTACAMPATHFEWSQHSVRDTQSMNAGMPRSPSSLTIHGLSPQRRVRSAVDLVSLVMQQERQMAAGGNGQYFATNV